MTLKLAENVLTLPVVTSLSIDSERVLNAALQANLKTCIVIGFDQDGEFYFASSEASGPSVLWDIEMAKKKLLDLSS